MRHRHWLFLGILAASIAGCAANTDELGTSDSALINGELDGDAHPGVGALAYNIGAARGGPDFWQNNCTVVNLGQGVLLTAAHCVPPPFLNIPVELFGVHFHEAEAPNGDNVIAVQGMEVHPEWSYTDRRLGHDVGVILVDPAAVRHVPSYHLPPVGTLDRRDRLGQLGAEDELTVVGYGWQEIPPRGPRLTPRQQGRMTVHHLSSTNIFCVQDLTEGDAGPFVGDSGGAVFLDNPAGQQPRLVGTVSAGEPYVGETVTHFHQRLDTQSVHDFVRSFMPGGA